MAYRRAYEMSEIALLPKNAPAGQATKGRLFNGFMIVESHPGKPETDSRQEGGRFGASAGTFLIRRETVGRRKAYW